MFEILKYFYYYETFDICCHTGAFVLEISAARVKAEELLDCTVKRSVILSSSYGSSVQLLASNIECDINKLKRVY